MRISSLVYGASSFSIAAAPGIRLTMQLFPCSKFDHCTVQWLFDVQLVLHVINGSTPYTSPVMETEFIRRFSSVKAKIYFYKVPILSEFAGTELMLYIRAGAKFNCFQQGHDFLRDCNS